MPTDVEHFAKGHAKPKPKTKVRPKTPRTARTEHEGRVPQPGVPSGPRNSAGGKKTVATVHADGHVTAKGPEAKKAKREAEASVRRLKAVRNYRREEGEDKPGPLPDIPKAVKKVVSAVERQDSSSKPVRELVEEEGSNLVKVAKRSLTPGREAEGIVKVPSSSETRAAAALTSGTLGNEGTATNVAEAGASAVSKAAKAATDEAASLAERVRTKPARVVQSVKEAPQKAKELPAKVEHAVTTPEGRAAAAKGAGKTAVRHPIRTGVPAAAIVPPGVIPGDVSDRARALLLGLQRAITHPGDMATATGHAVLGAFTAPLAVSASAIESAKQGDIGPLEQELGTLAQGTVDLGKKLISGNPKEVEQTFRHELGYVPLIPAPHIVKSVRNSDAATSLLGDIRGEVESKRAVKRNRLIADEKAAIEDGAYVSTKHAKKIKMPVEDTRTGQPYVNRRVGKFIEKNRARHDVSRIVSRTEQRGNYSAKAASQAIVKELRKSKLASRSEDNIGDAQRIFNKYGIPLDPEKGAPFIRMLHEGYGKTEHGDIPAGVHVDRHSARWLLDHPEAFSDPHLTKAVELFDKQAEKVGTSPRNRYLAVTDQILNPLRKAEGKRPILKPEERVTQATTDLMDQLVKSRDAHKDPWSRDEVLSYAKELQGKDGEALRKQIEATLVDEEGHPLMRPPEHGGAEHGVSTTRSTAWTPQMLSDYVNEVRPELKSRGLREPSAYVADVLPDSIKGKEPNFKAGIPVRKVWPSQGKAAASGNALSDFETFLQKSVEAPRHRASLVKGLDELFTKASRKIEGKRAFTDDEARRLINQHKVPDGTVWVRPQALKAVLEGEHAIDSEHFRAMLEGELENGARLASGENPTHLTPTGELRNDVEALKGVPGEKLAPMDGAYIKEFLGHMKPIEGLNSVIGNATRVTSRLILNSPAFEAIQIVQEGVPLASALARDIVHVPEAIKNLSKAKKLDQEGLADFKAAVGSSAGLYGTPSRAALNAEGYLDPIRLSAKPPVWRKALNLINGNYLGEFDRNRAGVMREVGATAREIGDFKRATKGFNVWRKAANNLYKDMDKAVEEMKGMDINERHAYIAKHPKLEERLQQSMDSMAGNWNSFTVFEKHVAPLTLFYTFQRYSALWMLFHFPLDHPIVATALSTLGAVNAKELQKLAKRHKGEPGILDYTMPVYSRGEGNEPNVLPAGKRAFPGLSTVQSAAISGKPSQLVGELPPPLTIPIEGALGKSSYTGQDLGENGWSYIAKSFAELNPAARLFLGLTGDESSAAKAFHAQDPLSKWRSFADPYIGQTGEQFGKTKELEKNFDLKYGKGNIPSAFDNPMVQELLYGGPGGTPQPKMLPEVLKAIHESERASNAVKKAEAPFNGPEKEFSELQKELLEEVENAWQTGPNVESESSSSNPFTKAMAESKGPATKNPFSSALAKPARQQSGNPFSQAMAK